MSPTSSASAIHVRAPGKLNLYFRVGSVMSDGYHEVASAYQAVSLYEDVWASHAEDFVVSFGGTIDTSELSTGSDNLALRAAKMLAQHSGYRGGVHLRIEKNVPIAGGMGGGSADAAATLVACDALWNTGLHRDELHELAARLGADVPFALMGGTAVGTGKGDELSPALAQGCFFWVLVTAKNGLSTPSVYRELDQHRMRHTAEIIPPPKQPVVDSQVLQALRAGDPHILAECIHNDLQVAALNLAPELAGLLEQGEESGALASIVSGSGPTVAFLAEDAESSIALQVALSLNGHYAVRATGPVQGARVISMT
ncbi:4-(cytidine 5'-diphospho)-2-C-methyl-D-erythritol kinase [Lysinibacter sp. HNR]|uniref:4-(cytidine 5'-diphospho)-2-C-methyl-D-erythritol kinase n=1 Tax=Lysinibacter sp. HNR TaxID=3031408 RepID=UPI002435E45D|nr:4-(cytidine 5'-diphospho)-2-C-methyl-D-erythritol kinase [Lysinibacter sp. HNR]WGD38160.1 4-(cytidine 5'-diphospho)-2-C-methyl-D-erythritol kinase [Lysinibacter sp. HNR]